MPADTATVTKLDALLVTIRAAPDPRRATAEWKQAYNLLKKTGAPAKRIDNIVLQRAVTNLAMILSEFKADLAGTTATIDAGAGRPDDATCKAAMKAFRRRLKFMRLDDESRIDSRDPLSKGESAQIKAIQPPHEWPADVWAELVRSGDLKRNGSGFYELTREG